MSDLTQGRAGCHRNVWLIHAEMLDLSTSFSQAKCFLLDYDPTINYDERILPPLFLRDAHNLWRKTILWHYHDCTWRNFRDALLFDVTIEFLNDLWTKANDIFLLQDI